MNCKTQCKSRETDTLCQCWQSWDISININLLDMQDMFQHPSGEQRIATSSQSGALSRNSLSCIMETEKDDEALWEGGSGGGQGVDRGLKYCLDDKKSQAEIIEEEQKKKKKTWGVGGVIIFLSLPSGSHLAAVCLDEGICERWDGKPAVTASVWTLFGFQNGLHCFNDTAPEGHSRPLYLQNKICWSWNKQ